MRIGNLVVVGTGVLALPARSPHALRDMEHQEVRRKHRKPRSQHRIKNAVAGGAQPNPCSANKAVRFRDPVVFVIVMSLYRTAAATGAFPGYYAGIRRGVPRKRLCESCRGQLAPNLALFVLLKLHTLLVRPINKQGAQLRSRSLPLS